MKYLSRIVGVLAVIVFGFVLGAKPAHANPADVQVIVGYQAWNSNDVTPLRNVGVSLTTVPDSNPNYPFGSRIPILPAPYSGNHFSPNCIFNQPCPAPTASSVLLNLNTNPFVNTTGVYICAPGASCNAATVFMDHLVWCGVGFYNNNPFAGPIDLGAGDYKMQATINLISSVTPNGGTWGGYWQWTDRPENGGATYASTFFSGNTAQVPANNGNVSLVYFVYKENPPSYVHAGYRIDRFGNQFPSLGNFGNTQGAKTSMDYWTSLPWSTNANPWSWSGINGGQNHHFEASSTADWDVTGWGLLFNSTGPWQYGYGSNGYDLGPQANGTRVDSRFFYEPKQSTINVSTKAKASASGAENNPCTASDFTSTACGQATLTAQRTGGPATPDSPARQGNFQKQYQNVTGTVSGTPNGGNNNSVDFGSLYYGTYNVTTTVPSGFKMAGWRIDGNWNGSTSTTIGVTVNPNRTVSVVPVFVPITIAIRGQQKSPGTFANGNSDTQQLNIGKIYIGSTQVGGATFSSSTSYNNGGSTISAEAPSGWQVRGYAFCVGRAGSQPDCTNDLIQAPGAQDQSNSTTGRIITQGNGSQRLDLNIDTSTAIPKFNNVAIDPNNANANELYIVFYFKPAPVRNQVRALINRSSPDSQYDKNLNPCTLNSTDYKYQDICGNVEYRVVRSPKVSTPNPGVNPIPNPLTPISSNDRNYVPTAPGYGYSVVNSHDLTTGNCAPAGYLNACSPGAGPWMKPGKKLTGYNTIVDDATAQAENLAVFDNLYPGNYTVEYNNATFPKKTSWGGGAYSASTSNCADGVTNCSDAVSDRALYGYCPLGFNQPWGQGMAYKDDYLPGEYRFYTSCRNDWGSPEGINVASGTRFDQLTQYGPFSILTPLPWCSTGNVFLAWCIGGYWVYPPPQAINSNNQDYSLFSLDRDVNIGVSNGFVESNFLWTPKPEISNVNINCEQITADIVYSPDPNRTVRTYITLDGQEVYNTDGTRVEATSKAGQKAVFNIPTRQFAGSNPSTTVNQTVWKDGKPHDLRFFTIYEDGDLQQPFKTSLTPTGKKPRYDPINPKDQNNPNNRPYLYRCQNQATCDTSAFATETSSLNTTDSDRALDIKVTMKNTGASYWWQQDNVQGTASEGNKLLKVDTLHRPGPGAGMRINTQYGAYGWTFTDQQLKDATTISQPVTPTSIDVTKSEVTFTFKVKTPADAVEGSVLSFAMYQDGYRFGTATYPGGGVYAYDAQNPDPASIECSTKIRVRANYKPWLRVQNGGVSALGEIASQPETSRGTYKAQNDSSPIINPNSGSGNGWFDGTKQLEPNMPRVASVNAHAQYVVVSALASGSSSFCSTNWYTLGVSNTTNGIGNGTPLTLFNRGCTGSIAGVDINMEPSIKTDFTNAEQGDQNTIFASASTSFVNNGQCEDTGATTGQNGPDPLAAMKKYYRSWKPGSAPNAADLNVTDKNFPSPFGVYGNGARKLVNLSNSNDNSIPGLPYYRPCPTIFKLSTRPAPTEPHVLGTPGAPILIGAGRSTLVVDGDLRIEGDIKNDFSQEKFDYKQEGIPGANNTIDLAGLNKIPNLGIVVNGDIIVQNNVTDIQANLFATGRLITCDKYVEQGGIDASGNEQGGTTGTLKVQPQNVEPNATDQPPNEDNANAKQCANPLKIRGSAAASRFALGRNYVDFAQMVRNFSLGANYPNKLIFTNGSTAPGADIANRKFCNLSTVPSIQRICTDTATGQRIDFDAPGTYVEGGIEKNYLRINGYPQSDYYGGPAEDFIGSGISSILPPPGFENIATDTYSRPKFVQQNAKPRF